MDRARANCTRLGAYRQSVAWGWTSLFDQHGALLQVWHLSL